MPLESVTHISDLVVTNPTSTDPKSEGDNHLRNIKTALKTDFPNISGPVTKTHTQLNNTLDKTGDAMTGNLNMPSLNTGQLAGSRNKVINGGFDVWQRGTSFVAPTSLYTADRWFAWTAQTAVTISRVARPTGNAGTYALQVNASVGTNNFNFTQPMESAQVDSIKGKVVTISVSGVAASGTQAFNLGLLKNAIADIMLGGSWSAVSAATTITLTTTAQRFSATFTVPNDGTANGLMVQISQSNITSGVNFQFWDFQLEVGSVATPFEQLPVGLVQSLCRRYTRIQAYQVPATTAQNLGTIDMRGTPTITGGGAGFTSTGTTADQLIGYQTAAAVQTLTLVSEL